jgi:hypothetical protein
MRYGLLVTAAAAALSCRLAQEGSARLKVEGRGAGLVGLRAMVCERDSVVGMVGTGSGWAMAIGVRTPWPPEAGTLPVRTDLDSAGSATVALRSIGDSISAGYTAHSGAVTLAASGQSLEGSFEALLVGPAGDTLNAAATLRRIALTFGACP